jgi:hypothetical protein
MGKNEIDDVLLLITIFYFPIQDAFLISASAAFLAYIQNTIEDLI